MDAVAHVLHLGQKYGEEGDGGSIIQQGFPFQQQPQAAWPTAYTCSQQVTRAIQNSTIKIQFDALQHVKAYVLAIFAL